MKFHIRWIAQYERHLSAAAMIGGFAFDNFAFRRIDMPNTQLVFIAYLAFAGGSIVLLHYLEARETAGKALPRWHAFLPAATQFALGGLWSGFLVFYSRSAVFIAAWPFMLVLAAIFIGNEALKKYHSRLAFTSILLFFAIFSYMIVTLPVVTRTIGTMTFLASGALALGLFLLFIQALTKFGLTQLRRAWGQIAIGVTAVYVLINVFYFTGVLPPLPLALSKAGVYRAVKKTGDVYAAISENEPWTVNFGATPVLHIAPGSPLSVYSAVFAPIKLSAIITHRWEHYDIAKGQWVTTSIVPFHIMGGRDGGYRAYSVKKNPAAGAWRVDIGTMDGRLVGRVRFTVELTANPPPDVPETLQ